MDNRTFSFQQSFTAAALAAAASAAINTALYFLGKALGFMSDAVLVPNQSEPITLAPVVISSIAPSLLAGVIFALLHRFTAQPARIFTILTVVVVALSFASPFMVIPNIPLGMGVWLNLMHIVVGGAAIFAFRRIPQNA
jgi:hypothetical protein